MYNHTDKWNVIFFVNFIRDDVTENSNGDNGYAKEQIMLVRNLKHSSYFHCLF